MTLLLKVMNNDYADEGDEDGLIETATAEVKVSGIEVTLQSTSVRACEFGQLLN